MLKSPPTLEEWEPECTPSSPTNVDANAYPLPVASSSKPRYLHFTNERRSELYSSAFFTWSSSGNLLSASFSTYIRWCNSRSSWGWLRRNPTSVSCDETTITKGFVFITVMLYIPWFASYSLVIRILVVQTPECWGMELTESRQLWL